MSAVYKASDPNLRRVVAVKLIHPHLSNQPEFLHRFEEEAAAVAQLRHPNIIQVYDFNHDNGIYYMVLEFIPGETMLDRFVRLEESGQHFALDDLMRYAVGVCDAIDYAHRRGMVHRDIKPANIMLDPNDQAILMDFGIAKMVGGQYHTLTGSVIGTALYMSPEQIRGEAVDGRSDIYSLGVTLFEMASGRPPFEADSTMTLMMMHLNQPVPNLRQLRPETPEGLVQIIEKCLAKDAAGRFESAAELAAALRREITNLKTGQTPSELVQVYQPTVRQPVSQPHFSASNAAPVISSGPIPASAAQRPAGSAVRSGVSPLEAQPQKRRLALLGGCAVALAALVCGLVGAGLLLNGSPGGAASSSPVSRFAATQTLIQQTRSALERLQTQPAEEAAPTSLAAAASPSTLEATVVSLAPVGASLTPPPAATPGAGSSQVPEIPAGGPYVLILDVRLDGETYVVNYETVGFIEQRTSRHIHFYFDQNTSGPGEIPSGGAYVMYAGPRPFRDITVADVPQGAKRICASAATVDHQFIPNSGNCVDLPALPSSPASLDTAATPKPEKERPGYD